MATNRLPLKPALERRHAQSADGPRRPPIWGAYGVLAVLLAAYLVSEVIRRDGQTWPLIDNWGVAGFELALSVLCLARVRGGWRLRTVPLALGLGILSWSIGDLVLAIESVGGATPPVPSLADALYLSFYPITYVAIMLFARREIAKFSVATWLDGAIAGVGAAAVCAAFAFNGVLHSAGGSSLSVATNLAYPVGDVLLLGLVVAGTAVLPGRRKAPWMMLATGCGINAIGDTANLFSSTFGASHVGTLLNAVAWPTSILLISASVWIRPRRTSPLVLEQAPSFVLPGLAAGAALTILFVGSLHHVGAVALVLALATLVIAGVRASLSLVSLRAMTEDRRRQAVTDQLTGLGNRRALFQLLDAYFGEATDPDGPTTSLAFMFVDLNAFKEVNDSFGHAIGDELLRQLGARLQGSLRGSDLLVRLGGDEFAVALMDAGADYAATVAQRLIGRIEEPFSLQSVRTAVSASIGIALSPKDAIGAADLVRCADLAMYRAKLGKKAFAIYQEDLDGSGDRLRLVEELRSAIDQHELELYYQPQVDLTNGEIVAVEALVRWSHPRLGFIPPVEFVPLAEEAGLMRELTAMVMETALRQCAEWWSGGQSVTMAINISTTNLLDDGFIEMVEWLLQRHRLPPRALVLEITETTAISDFERCKQTIEELRGLGLVVSVDDFGAGFTSLAYLSSLAVGELKLDRSFIHGLTTEQGRDLTLIRSTIQLAHSLGLRVVAEGVEDEDVLKLLSGLGCDLAQGYVISRPKPATELALPSAVQDASRAAAGDR
jgi:diguanylate cyclase (GGDEF)-like protein